MAKTAGAMVVAGGTAVVALTKQAVEAYAEYEQLSGGVKKLFGNDAQQMLKYAQDAYKTAGMSANQYLDISTSFASSLIQSYGGDTAKAVEQTDKAMRAISDNFNTFGGDINSIQNAFQGFAKQNYTMLDNLKLGYGGTKSEMERLIADANEYAKSIGQAGDLSIDKFGDIVEAIDLIQQKQGIAGTTAKEAMTTISGSINMLKASWANLLTAMGDGNADLGKAIDAVVESAEATVNNLLPVIEQALLGIGEMIETLAPTLGEKLPPLIEALLPSLVNALVSLINSLATALPGLVQTLLPPLVSAVAQVIQTLASNLPALLSSIMQAIISAIPQIIVAGVALFTGLVQAIAESIPQIIEALPQIFQAIVQGFVEAWPMLKEAGLALMKMAGEGIKSAGELVKSIVSGIWNAIKSVTSSVWESIKSKITSIWDGIKSSISNAINNIKSTISSGFNSALSTATSIFTSIKTKITSIINGARDAVKNAIDKIKSFFNFSWSLPKLKLPHISISGSFSLSPPSVPHFSISWYANGGVFDFPTLFGYGRGRLGGLGENGAEAIVPLEKNTEWLDKIADRLASRLGNNTVIMEVDGKVFGQVAVDSINGLTRQTGKLNIMMA